MGYNVLRDRIKTIAALSLYGRSCPFIWFLGSGSIQGVISFHASTESCTFLYVFRVFSLESFDMRQSVQSEPVLVVLLSAL